MAIAGLVQNGDLVGPCRIKFFFAISSVWSLLNLSFKFFMVSNVGLAGPILDCTLNSVRVPVDLAALIAPTKKVAAV